MRAHPPVVDTGVAVGTEDGITVWEALLDGLPVAVHVSLFLSVILDMVKGQELRVLFPAAGTFAAIPLYYSAAALPPLCLGALYALLLRNPLIPAFLVAQHAGRAFEHLAPHPGGVEMGVVLPLATGRAFVCHSSTITYPSTHVQSSPVPLAAAINLPPLYLDLVQVLPQTLTHNQTRVIVRVVRNLYRYQIQRVPLYETRQLPSLQHAPYFLVDLEQVFFIGLIRTLGGKLATVSIVNKFHLSHVTPQLTSRKG